MYNNRLLTQPRFKMKSKYALFVIKNSKNIINFMKTSWKLVKSFIIKLKIWYNIITQILKEISKKKKISYLALYVNTKNSEI